MSADTRYLRVVLKPELTQVAEVRDLMARVARAAHLDAERAFDLKVVVSEACANAIEHASSQVEVVAWLLPDRVLIEVTNDGTFQPGRGKDGEGRRRGMGLPLMASLTDQFHLSRLPGPRTRVSLSFLLSKDAAQSHGSGEAPDMILKELETESLKAAAAEVLARRCAEDAQRATVSLASTAAHLRELSQTLEAMSRACSFGEAADHLVDWAQSLTGCDAAMLRLVEPQGIAGGWIPALVHRGLNARFLQDEALIGAQECMCGRVCQGRGDPGLPFFTPGGSFCWGRVQSIGEEFSPEILGSVRGRCIVEGYDSIGIFPLAGREGPVGSLHLADFRANRFNSHVELLETICRICGPLLLRHRDQEYEHALVTAAQSALTPEKVPEIEGLDLAVAFSSATEGAAVGGDFYDAFRLDSGATLLFVGDYTGSGIEVAGMAARVRETLADLGRTGDDPGELLGRANRILKESLPAGRFVTAVVCRCSPEGELTAAVAGHPRPLRLEEGGGAEEISLPPNAPLGAASNESFATRTVHLSPGQGLLLFTDGISESRHAGEFFGTEGIARVWKMTSGQPMAQFADTLCRESERFHKNGHSRDDRLALAARRLT